MIMSIVDFWSIAIGSGLTDNAHRQSFRLMNGYMQVLLYISNTSWLGQRSQAGIVKACTNRAYQGIATSADYVVLFSAADIIALDWEIPEG